ncbi:Hypothetical protein ETEE_3605 [Edwardsiella anguillarum ET080813]|uniref:Uncharacterized protein n=1 Tax=Edwardsiella anguillarum ET080813 TaxID=667120 RepID=A0A076LND8_9GAMM|nr:Hypothetical protein ETEE_3605 [Edwardsiella anguillarum ET080813]
MQGEGYLSWILALYGMVDIIISAIGNVLQQKPSIVPHA